MFREIDEIPARGHDLERGEGENVEVGGGGALVDQPLNRSTHSRPSWQGVSLFPPKRMSKNPSKVWKYGGFRKGADGQLRTEKTVCGFCGDEQKFRGTPSNFGQHLKIHHAGQVDLAVGESSQSNSKTPSNAMVQAKFKKRQLDALKLKDEDVNKMKQLVKVLFMHNLTIEPVSVKICYFHSISEFLVTGRSGGGSYTAWRREVFNRKCGATFSEKVEEGVGACRGRSSVHSKVQEGVGGRFGEEV